MSQTQPPADVIRLQSVSKQFKDSTAVNDISFSVNAGEVFGFLGPNGAGKSTTIRMMLDVLRPTSGTIELFGLPNRLVKQTHRRMGYLSGDMVFEDGLTGRQYLQLAAAQYGKDCSQSRQVLAERLQAGLDIKLGQYSRGNRQKIGLIAALQHDPELLVLDEPTSGFDPLVQEEFAKLIQEFKQSGGTVFMSSHILSEVQELCDRVAFIKDGNLLTVTTVSELTSSAAKRIRIKAPVAQLTELRRKLGRADGVRLDVTVDDYVLALAYDGSPTRLLQLLAGYDIQDLTIEEPDLEQVFMRYYQPPSGASA